MEYKIIADGACDLYGENADKIGVQIVPFYVAFEENVYKKEGAEIEVRHFYKEMVENPTVLSHLIIILMRVTGLEPARSPTRT